MKKIKNLIGCLLVLISLSAPTVAFAESNLDNDIETKIDEILNDFNFKTQETNIKFFSINPNDINDENIEISENDGLISWSREKRNYFNRKFGCSFCRSIWYCG